MTATRDALKSLGVRVSLEPLDRPLKIVTVIPDFDRRGAQRVGQSFSVRFRQLGHDVAVLPLLPEGPRRAGFAAAGIRIFDAVPNIDVAVEQVRTFAPDVIHFHRSGVTIPSDTQLLQQLRPLSKCIVEMNIFARYDPTARDLIDVHFNLTRLGLFRWNRLAPAPSESDAVGIYLPNPVELTAFVKSDPVTIAAYRRDVLGAADGDFIFGRIGKMDRAFFRMFERVLARNPRARLASIATPDIVEVQRSAPAHVRSRIVDVPPTDSDAALCRFYSSIDALLHWSYNGESFGMVLAESMACGTPVVMPMQLHRDLGGLEVIGHMKGGIIAGHGGNLHEAALKMMEIRPSFDATLPAVRERLTREYDLHRICDIALSAMRLAIEARQAGRPVREVFVKHGGFVTSVSQADFENCIRAHYGHASVAERIALIGTHHALLAGIPRTLKRILPA